MTNYQTLYGVHSVDFDDLEEALRAAPGNGVVSGLTASVTGSDLTVTIAAGYSRVNGAFRNFTGTTAISFTGDPDGTNPKKAVIVINAAGTITKRVGTAAVAAPVGQVRRFTYTPAPPDLVAGDVVLCEVYLAAGATTIASADVTDRRVLVSLAPSDYDYLVWSDGTNVYGVNSNTKAVDYTGTDWVTIVNSILGVSTAHTIFIHESVPTSTGTVNVVNKNQVTLLCPRRQGRVASGGPQCYKLLVQCTSTSTHSDHGLVEGIRFDEIEFNNTVASFSGGIAGWTFNNCSTHDQYVGGRRGIRFTGSGDIEDIRFLNHYASAEVSGTATDPTHFMSFEGSTTGTGHISVMGLFFENNNFSANCSFITYRGSGRSGPQVAFYGGSVVLSINSASTGCHLVHTNLQTPTNGNGPASLGFYGLHLEMHGAGQDIFRLENNTNPCVFRVVWNGGDLTIAGGTSVYTWVQNVTTGFYSGIASLTVENILTAITSAFSGSGSWTYGAPAFGTGFLCHIRKVSGFNFGEGDFLGSASGATANLGNGGDDRAGITANDAAPVVLFTVPAGTSVALRVSLHLYATAYTSGTISYTLAWTQGVAKTRAITTAALQTLASDVFIVKADPTTAVTVQITGFGVATVTVLCALEKMNR